MCPGAWLMCAWSCARVAVAISLCVSPFGGRCCYLSSVARSRQRVHVASVGPRVIESFTRPAPPVRVRPFWLCLAEREKGFSNHAATRTQVPPTDRSRARASSMPGLRSPVLNKSESSARWLVLALGCICLIANYYCCEFLKCIRTPSLAFPLLTVLERVRSLSGFQTTTPLP